MRLRLLALENSLWVREQKHHPMILAATSANSPMLPSTQASMDFMMDLSSASCKAFNPVFDPQETD